MSKCTETRSSWYQVPSSVPGGADQRETIHTVLGNHIYGHCTGSIQESACACTASIHGKSCWTPRSQ